MKFPKTLLFIAGVYGLIVLIPGYFMETKTGRDFPPAITHPEYYYGFIGVAIAWQIAFLIMSSDPVRYRAMIIPGVIEKASFGIACLVLYFHRELSPGVLGFGLIDLTLAVLFLVAYAKTGPGADMRAWRNLK
jgi:hypothetical protein